MGSFTLSVSGTGYQKLPSGFILQWGSIGAPGIAQDVVTHFPIAFPNRCLRVLVSQDGSDSNLLIVFYVQIMPDDLVMQLHRF
ncbi:gp53-like domain-containing protein [Escherichia coli]